MPRSVKSGERAVRAGVGEYERGDEPKKDDASPLLEQIVELSRQLAQLGMEQQAAVMQSAREMSGQTAAVASALAMLNQKAGAYANERWVFTVTERDGSGQIREMTAARQ